MPLEPEDQQHLTAAHGYIELKMYLDANDELEKIDPDVRHLPEVLSARLGIYSGLEKWGLMQAVAKKLTRYEPDNVRWWFSWAYATRQAESVAAARLVLLQAIETHATESAVHYNLACYECLGGDLGKAKAYLATAFKLDPGCRIKALDDEDLRALWDSI
jgi:tetratricopeptide (TPR) repeat protein